MASTIIQDDEGRTWTIFHNGDWSGDVEIRRHGEPLFEDITLPGAVIRKACAAAVKTDLIAMIEQWDGAEGTASRAERIASHERYVVLAREDRHADGTLEFYTLATKRTFDSISAAHTYASGISPSRAPLVLRYSTWRDSQDI